jgi:hypothetical protein
LAYQSRLQQHTGQNNAYTLLGVEQIPWDNQVRKLLDPMAPSQLDPVFLEIFESLALHHMLANVRVLGDQLLVAKDGTHYFSSKALHCFPRRTVPRPWREETPEARPYRILSGMSRPR